MSSEYSYLFEVIQKLSASHKIEDLMHVVRAAARKIAGADGATFVLRDGAQCFYADEDAIGPLWKGQRFPMEKCISGWAMIHRETVLVPDIHVDSRIPLEAYLPTFVKSLAITPVCKDKPIAAIGTYWSRPYTPTPVQLELLQALANAVSVAMENIDLYRRLEGRIAEAQSVADAKDEFLMVLSHELRTPMTSVLGWTEILHEQSQPGSDLRYTLETILRNARTQMKIIDDLIDTSQIVHGHMRMEMVMVDVISLLEGQIQDLMPEANKKQISVSFEKKVSKAEVLGDPERLRQTFSNLLTNAIKFSSVGQEIRIVAKTSGSFIKVDFRDEGIGVDPAFLPHIFERFRKGGKFLNHESGLGLGLTIVQHLVKSHNGEISVDSQGPGKGCTFSVTLPLLDESSAVADTSNSNVL